MQGAAAINIKVVRALLRAPFCERKKNVEQLHGPGGTMLAIFVRPASKTPQVTAATWGKVARETTYIGPKRCRYSLELMNAFTISD